MEARKEAGDDIGDDDTEMRVDMEKNNITKLPEEGGGRQSRIRHQRINPAYGGRLGKVLLLGKVCYNQGKHRPR